MQSLNRLSTQQIARAAGCPMVSVLGSHSTSPWQQSTGIWRTSSTLHATVASLTFLDGLRCQGWMYFVSLIHLYVANVFNLILTIHHNISDMFVSTSSFLVLLSLSLLQVIDPCWSQSQTGLWKDDWIFSASGCTFEQWSSCVNLAWGFTKMLPCNGSHGSDSVLAQPNDAGSQKSGLCKSSRFCWNFCRPWKHDQGVSTPWSSRLCIWLSFYPRTQCPWCQGHAFDVGLCDIHQEEGNVVDCNTVQFVCHLMSCTIETQPIKQFPRRSFALVGASRKCTDGGKQLTVFPSLFPGHLCHLGKPIFVLHCSVPKSIWVLCLLAALALCSIHGQFLRAFMQTTTLVDNPCWTCSSSRSKTWCTRWCLSY